jgi:hypothetical protein
MTRINKKALNTILIANSSVNKFSETATSLSFLARQAYSDRNYELLSPISDLLINLSQTTEETGRFYKALWHSKRGVGNLKQSHEILESLADSSRAQIRAASLCALGINSYHLGDMAEAIRLLSTTNQIALSENICAPFTAVYSAITLSAIQCDNGATMEGLKTLQNVEPLARYLGYISKSLLGDFYNNYACCLSENDELEAAYYYSNLAISTEVALNFPDWFESKQEIDQKLYEKNYLKLVSLTEYDRAQIAENVSQISSKQNFYICLDYYDTRYKVFKFITDNSDESDTRFSALTLTLESLCAKANTGIKVIGFFSPVDPEEYQFQVHLARERIDDFLILIKNIESFEAKFPLKEYGNEISAELDLTTYERIIQWVKSFADNGETLDIPTFENSAK